jgi:hypothetical protein
MSIVGVIIRFKKKKNYVEGFSVCNGVSVLDGKGGETDLCGDADFRGEGGLEEREVFKFSSKVNIKI